MEEKERPDTFGFIGALMILTPAAGIGSCVIYLIWLAISNGVSAWSKQLLGVLSIIAIIAINVIVFIYVLKNRRQRNQ